MGPACLAAAESFEGLTRGFVSGAVRPPRPEMWFDYPDLAGLKDLPGLKGVSRRIIFPMTLPDLEPLIEIEEDTDQRTAEEPLYRVLIHNDDVTPMDFVVTVLRNIFKLSAPDAVEVMYIAHHTGLALVQILPKSEAESRIAKAQFAAGMEGYPLKFSMEPE